MPPPVLPYADTTTPPGVDALQVVRVADDVRRIVVPSADGLHRGVSFEVSPFALRVDRVDVFGVTHRAWPRSAVLDVRMNRVTRGLVLRLAGEDTLDVPLGPDGAANELVMHELLAALTAILPAPPGSQVRPSPSDGLRPSTARSALLTVASGMVVAGVACLCIGFAGHPRVGMAGLGLMLASAGPAGIALGTQRKDIWT